jgi:outer membrane receptor protein involved in Fe transport
MKRGSRAAALLLSAMLLAFSTAGGALAQGLTTSAFTGRVTTDAGEAVQGAQIVATNAATGAVSRAVTRGDGRYLLPGLQPGTYTLSASRIGSAAQTRQGVALALGQQAEVNFQLASEALSIEGITATAERNAIISRGRTGASAVVSDSTLRRAPTLTRDLQDFTRLVPQLAVTNQSTGAVTGGGRNNRFNSVQIDGSANNDLFGLSASGSPGGQAGAKPITLEAIQELQVVLAPFDVRQSGFTGVQVNAITRSGTNRFQGSLSGFGRNEGFVGRYQTFSDSLSRELDDFQQTEFAGSFGGPIVRDRAFFFLAGEVTDRSQPTNYIAGTDASLGTTEAQANEVGQYLQTRYNYNAGNTTGSESIARQSLNLFGRLDFNLGENQRLTVRHNYVDGEREDFGRGNRGYLLGGAGYTQFSTTNGTVAQLNSGFGRFFNELRVGYTTVRDERQVAGTPFPRVTVRYGSNSVIAGTEAFSAFNVLNQDIFELTNDLSFSVGSHNLNIGTNNEFFTFYNLFVDNAFGVYEFDTFAAFQAGTPSRFDFKFLNPDTDPTTAGNQPGQEAAEFDARRLGLYAQDRWDVSDNLQLTLGLRLDQYGYPDSPSRNVLVEQYYGRRTDEVPDNTLLFSPRFGFNWDVAGDNVTQVRGGAGLFAGRQPYVWISNAYGNTGVDYISFSCRSLAASPAFVADPLNQPRNCRGASTVDNTVNTVDPDFESPQVARYNLAVDRQLPFGLVGTLEGLYTKTINDLLYRNLRVRPDPQGRLVEGRPRSSTIPSDSTPNVGDVYDLTNTSAGYSYNLTAQLQRPFRDGWEASIAYTNSRAKDKNPLTSSRAISNYRFNLHQGNPNDPELATSDFDIPHRIVAQATRRFEYLRGFPTDLSVVYIGQSGRPYSYRYGNDINFDGQDGNDLLFVPADPSQIRFEPYRAPGTTGASDRGQLVTPEQSWQNLNEFIERVSCLRSNRGQIIDRNECREPWYSRFDVRLAQSLRVAGRQNAQITLDILNFANLLNDQWGRLEFVDNQADALLRLSTSTGVNNNPDAQGRRVYQAFTPRSDIFTISNLESRYQVQLGLRYSF